MKTATTILLLLLVGVLSLALLMKVRRGPVPATPQVLVVSPTKTQWTPEEIAADPVGYLMWSDQQVQTQIVARDQRLQSLSARRAELAVKQGELVGKIDEVQNFHDRLETAYRRAADEGRWPLRMAGRSFERARARDILDETAIWLEDRKPLAEAYVASLGKMDHVAGVLRSDIRGLGQLRERIALDIERVKLNEGTAEIDQLRKTEGELASMSRTLSQMSDEQAPALSETSKSAHVDIDSILK